MAIADDEPRPARVRIRDVAHAAGVSVTTTSDALNGRGRVEAGTRARVLEAAERLGYRANVHARMLRRGRSGVLGIMSSLAADSSTNLSGIEYFVDILSSAATTALSHGYAVMLMPPSPDNDATQRDVAVDGALLLDPVAGSTTVNRLEQSGIPTVSTGRLPGVPADSVTWVDNDIPAEVARALDLLWDRGARDVALITNPPIRSYAVDTIRAYDSWVEAHGLPRRVVETDELASESSAFVAASPLFAHRDDRPDAIFAPLDRLAVGAMLAARSAGLEVPRDVLIASGVDSQATRLARPAVTAVELHARDIGHRALELLVDRVEQRQEGHRQVIVPATLHERASTRRPGTRRRRRRAA
jgi:DNA-binding LacI/PurR family transcriptional regulator